MSARRRRQAAPDPPRLNLGCGVRKLPDHWNVDSDPGCEPDERVDLEETPWPWPDDCVESVMLSHVLEHLGRDTPTYLAIIRELYRVCRHGAEVTIVVPHPRHDQFLNDPTHVRPITVEGLDMFNHPLNDEWARLRAANSRLAHGLGVDMRRVSTEIRLDEPWRGEYAVGRLSAEQLTDAIRRYNNVVTQTKVTLRVHKPPGTA